MAIDCRRKQEKWFFDKYLTESTSKYSHCSSEGGYNGVDSYRNSPIWQTHWDIVEANKREYNDKTKKSYQESMDNFCKDFDVSEFTKKRDKCDKKSRRILNQNALKTRAMVECCLEKAKKLKS